MAWHQDIDAFRDETQWRRSLSDRFVGIRAFGMALAGDRIIKLAPGLAVEHPFSSFHRTVRRTLDQDPAAADRCSLPGAARSFDENDAVLLRRQVPSSAKEHYHGRRLRHRFTHGLAQHAMVPDRRGRGLRWARGHRQAGPTCCRAGGNGCHGEQERFYHRRRMQAAAALSNWAMAWRTMRGSLATRPPPVPASCR